MERCKLGNPHETIYALGHAFRRNYKLDDNHKMSWDNEWFCEYCMEKITATSAELYELQWNGGPKE